MLSEVSQSEKNNYDLTDMWNLRNKAEDHREREEKMKQDKDRVTNHKRLLISGIKLKVAGVEGGRGMGWLGDGHWGGYVLWGALCIV